jgi:hypothetical protein
LSVFENGVLTDTVNVLITHSMGGLTTAGAFADQKCSKPDNYFTSQPPYSGSKAADAVVSICNDTVIRARIAYLAHYCRREVQWCFWGVCHYHYFPWYGHTTLGNDPSRNPIITPDEDSNGSSLVFEWEADGKYCGSSPDGIGALWFEDTMLSMIDLYASMQEIEVCVTLPRCGYGYCYNYTQCTMEEYNDGMVDVYSCRAGVEVGGNNAIYIEGANHKDGSCHNGDSSSGGAEPCQWMIDMMDDAS